MPNEEIMANEMGRYKVTPVLVSPEKTQLT